MAAQADSGAGTTGVGDRALHPSSPATIQSRRPKLEAKLQQLLDEAEIRRVHIRYCRGIDRMDWDLVRSCYHPDAIDRHGAYNGGVEGFIGWAAELLPNFEATQHFTGNQYVEVHGDVALAGPHTPTIHQ